MMPVIRISDETMARLGKFARPFVDTPEDVVRLALDALETSGLVGRTSSPPQRERPRTKRGRSDRLPQKEFHAPLVEVLRELGGKGTPKQVREAIEKKLTPKLKEGDYEEVSTGDPRWWNAVCWARNDLRKSGVLKPDSQWGVWELA